MRYVPCYFPGAITQEVNMLRIAVPLSILAAALVGCASQQQPAPTPSVAQKPPRIAAQAMPFQPGIGVIVAAAPRPAPLSAGAGATSAANPRAAATTPPDTMRLTLRMDNGRTQYVDMAAGEYQREFRVGQRVELTRDGFMKALP
jgi:hypothetical protein